MAAVNIHDLERETGLGGKVIRRKIRALNLGARAAGLTQYSWEDNSAQLKLIRAELAKLAGKPASNGKSEGAVAAAPEAKAETGLIGLFVANSSGVVNGFHKVGAAQAAPGPISKAVPESSPDSGQSSQPEAQAPAPEASPASSGKAKRSRPTSSRPIADINHKMPAARTKEETDYLRGYQIKELQPGHKLECEVCLDRLQIHTKALFLALLKPKRWANVCLEHCREGGVGPSLARGEEVEGYNLAHILNTRTPAISSGTSN